MLSALLKLTAAVGRADPPGDHAVGGVLTTTVLPQFGRGLGQD